MHFRESQDLAETDHRGMVSFIDSLVTGTKCLMYSAELQVMRRTRKRPERMLLFLQKNWKPRRKKKTRHLKPCSM